MKFTNLKWSDFSKYFKNVLNFLQMFSILAIPSFSFQVTFRCTTPAYVPYGLFVILFEAKQEEQPSKWQYGHNSAPRPNIKNIKALYFLQLLKLKKAKHPYFFEFWPRDWDMVTFISCPLYFSLVNWLILMRKLPKHI